MHIQQLENQTGGMAEGVGGMRGRVGLGWVGLGWVGLGWVGLGWVGLGWVGLGWVGWGGVGGGAGLKGGKEARGYEDKTRLASYT